MDTSNAVFHPEPVSISPYSRACCHIEMLRIDHGKEIGNAKASGFFWTHDKSLFLVTNWHVVTGINPITGFNIGTFTPNAMRINYFVEWRSGGGKEPDQWFLGSTTSLLELDSDDPIDGWRTHPNGRSADLAAKEIDWEESSFWPICLNLTKLEEHSDLSIGDDVFILGFPEGSSFDRRLPLWKRGSVATDPALNQNNAPQFYVDTIGNSGLSGAPVIHRRQFAAIDFSNNDGSSSEVRKGYSFAGVYSGRLGEEGIQSQLGRIIRRDALFELFENMGTA